MTDEFNSTVEKLAALLRSSSEYMDFDNARKQLYADAVTSELLADYNKLQLKLQAAELSGTTDPEEMLRLQKLGELLQMNPAASKYLFAQYRLNSLLGSVYRKLAAAVDADLSMIDE